MLHLKGNSSKDIQNNDYYDLFKIGYMFLGKLYNETPSFSVRPPVATSAITFYLEVE